MAKIRFIRKIIESLSKRRKKIEKRTKALSAFYKSLRDFNYEKIGGSYTTEGIKASEILAIFILIGNQVKAEINEALSSVKVFYSPSVKSIKSEVVIEGIEPQPIESDSYIKYTKQSYGYPSGVKYSNILNVRPIKSGEEYSKFAYPGQTGIYKTKSGYFASFSDPYYGIAKAAKLIDSYKLSGGWKKERINKYGQGRYTLLAMTSIFVGESENSNYRYAKYIADHGNFPQGVDTVIDFENNMDQFIDVLQAMAQLETSTKLSRDYLAKVWRAIYQGDAPPLRNILDSSIDNKVELSVSRTFSDNGVNNKQ